MARRAQQHQLRWRRVLLEEHLDSVSRHLEQVDGHGGFCPVRGLLFHAIRWPCLDFLLIQTT